MVHIHALTMVQDMAVADHLHLLFPFSSEGDDSCWVPGLWAPPLFPAVVEDCRKLGIGKEREELERIGVDYLGGSCFVQFDLLQATR